MFPWYGGSHRITLMTAPCVQSISLDTVPKWNHLSATLTCHQDWDLHHIQMKHRPPVLLAELMRGKCLMLFCLQMHSMLVMRTSSSSSVPHLFSQPQLNDLVIWICQRKQLSCLGHPPPPPDPPRLQKPNFLLMGIMRRIIFHSWKWMITFVLMLEMFWVQWVVSTVQMNGGCSLTARKPV